MLWIIKQLIKLCKRQDVLNLVVADRFRCITQEDILRTNHKGNFTFLGQELSDEQKSRLIAEATKFKESFLWRILKKDIHYQAGLKSLEKAKSMYDLVAGKETIFLLDTIQTKLDSLEKMSHPRR